MSLLAWAGCLGEQARLGQSFAGALSSKLEDRSRGEMLQVTFDTFDAMAER
jgi:hypothetical protein